MTEGGLRPAGGGGGITVLFNWLGLGGKLIIAASPEPEARGCPSRRLGRTMRTVSFLGSDIGKSDEVRVAEKDSSQSAEGLSIFRARGKINTSAGSGGEQCKESCGEGSFIGLLMQCAVGEEDSKARAECSTVDDTGVGAGLDNLGGGLFQYLGAGALEFVFPTCETRLGEPIAEAGQHFRSRLEKEGERPPAAWNFFLDPGAFDPGAFDPGDLKIAEGSGVKNKTRLASQGLEGLGERVVGGEGSEVHSSGRGRGAPLPSKANHLPTACDERLGEDCADFACGEVRNPAHRVDRSVGWPAGDDGQLTHHLFVWLRRINGGSVWFR